MDVTFTLSENEYVKANRLYGKPTRGIKLFYLITFIALVVTFILSETLKIKVIVSVGFICGVIGHCLIAYVYAPWQTRKQYKSYKAVCRCCNITSHSKGQITVGFCSFVAYFNQLLFAS